MDTRVVRDRNWRCRVVEALMRCLLSQFTFKWPWSSKSDERGDGCVIAAAELGFLKLEF